MRYGRIREHPADLLPMLGNYGIYCDSAIDLVALFRKRGCGLAGAVMVRCLHEARRQGKEAPTDDEAYATAQQILSDGKSPSEFFSPTE